MTKIISHLHSFVWGVPLLTLLIGVGLYLTVMTDFVQIRLFGKSIHLFFSRLHDVQDRSGIPPMQALCTALAATVGTGNLVGVAGAICLGGPGAVFWMWVCGIIGMATKYAEVTLAVRYRLQRGREYLGGPMYMISRGMRFPWLGKVYALLGLLACFGVGNFAQINAVVTGVNGALAVFGSREIHPLLLGVLLAILTGLTLLGGAGRIGKTAERIVPGAAIVYVLLCLTVLILRAAYLPKAIQAIFSGAFSPKAVTGGAVGSVFMTLRTGCSRGVFSNEAGMGTASMAHAAAQTNSPAEQGMLGIVEVFLDTLVICTMTALVILVSGVPIRFGTDAGAALAESAFTGVLGPWCAFLLAGCFCSFGFATVLGWGLYGANCADFLFGRRAVRPFYILQSVLVIFGAAADTKAVWQLCETLNGAMAIPNLIALAALSPELRRLTIDYISGSRAANGGTYANFHQCKPL